MSNYQEQLYQHYAPFFGMTYTARTWEQTSSHLLPRGFHVLEYPPQGSRDMWTYATVGMEANTIELHMFSSRQDELLVELLTYLAYYHNNRGRMDLHHTVYFARAWQDRSKCEYGLVSLPYLDGPALEHFGLTKCYWMLPVTKTECDFKEKAGVEELEALFEATGLNYIDPERAGVA